MSEELLFYLAIGAIFALYLGVGLWTRAGSTSEYYLASKGVRPVLSGMATAADWMSAATFLSMAGLIAVSGQDGSVYLMGWTGGYVLLALCIAPYLRRFGKFTLPDFIGVRYYSSTARLIAVICVLFISFTYVSAQMRGIGIVLARYLGVHIETGVILGMAVVLVYAVFGGMRGITYTQVAHFCVMTFAYLVPAVFLSLLITGSAIPQLGLASNVQGSEQTLIERLNGLGAELGFAAYTDGSRPTLDLLLVTLALMAGTAGLPHVIARFFTTPSVRAARKSAAYALLFIALLYSTAPAVAAFARFNLLSAVPEAGYAHLPEWFKQWENTGLIAWMDKNADGIVQYGPGEPFDGRPAFSGAHGASGERLLDNPATPLATELYLDPDILVLASPEMADLPAWVVALVAAGALAAALSTAAALVLVIATSISHDLLKRRYARNLSEQGELRAARLAAALAVLGAGFFGIYPPGLVAQVVAFAFNLAAAAFFPVIVLGVLSTRMNKQGAIAGMLVGLGITLAYIVQYRVIQPTAGPEDWWFGISPEGIGAVGMLCNLSVALVVARLSAPPPDEIQQLIVGIRLPRSSVAKLDAASAQSGRMAGD